jgi:hypothetical protein
VGCGSGSVCRRFPRWAWQNFKLGLGFLAAREGLRRKGCWRSGSCRCCITQDPMVFGLGQFSWSGHVTRSECPTRARVGSPARKLACLQAIGACRPCPHWVVSCHGGSRNVTSLRYGCWYSLRQFVLCKLVSGLPQGGLVMLAANGTSAGYANPAPGCSVTSLDVRSATLTHLNETRERRGSPRSNGSHEPSPPGRVTSRHSSRSSSWGYCGASMNY